MLQDTPTRLLEQGEPVPEGWQPLVNLQLPDGTMSTARAEAISKSPRTPAEIESHIRVNVKRPLPRLLGRAPMHGRTMVLCAYGPSLRETWRSAVAEQGDLWTVSGAHAFLLERGVEPAFHTDVDPRPHKAHFLDGPTDIRTRYYLPSRCSPETFARVEGKDVTLYHIKCKNEKEVIDVVEPGAFLVPSAITAGLVALQLGLVLGYRKFLIYGMDGSADPRNTSLKHSGAHPNVTEGFESLVEIEGRGFATNMLMLLAVDDFFAIATQWEPGTFEFRGDGMLPWIARVSLRQHTVESVNGS